MARNVLPIIGQAIGAYFGGPWGAAIGQAIGTVVGNAVDPLVIDGPKIGEVAQQTSSEGVYQPIYFGTSQGAGNIIAQGPNVIRRRRQTQGKGGGPVTVTETLYKTFAIRIGVSWKGEEGIVGISRIWENGKLVYDVRPTSQIVPESAQFAAKFRLYLGTDTQSPDPALEAVYGVGNTPSYRGRSYIVFPLYDITAWKAIPQYSFEVVTSGTSRPAVQAIALKEDPNLTFDYWLSSPDNLDWTGSWQPDSVLEGRARNLLASTNRFIAYGTGSLPVYLDAGDSVWNESTGDPVGASGDQHIGAIDSITHDIVIPQGLFGGTLRSEDNGESWLHIPGPSCNAFVYAGLSLMSISTSTANTYRSINNGSGWGLIENVSSYFNVFAGVCRFSSPNLGFFGASTNLIEGVKHPALIETLTGLSWDFHSFTTIFDADADRFVCGCSGSFDGVEYVYVAVANNGQLIYRIGDVGGWVLSAYNFPVPPWDITFDGVRFIMIGSSTAGGGTGLIATSEDLESWTVRRSSSTIADENWYRLQALSLSGGGVVSEPPHLDEVIATIHTWCGQPTSEYDVSTLSDILVRGYVLAGGYTAKEAINTLQNLWTIDSPEYDKAIHYRKRGANIVGSYTFDDLIDEPEEATREQAIEYPKKLHLDYQSPDVEYAPAKATSSRSSIDARVIGEVGIQVPVVLTPTEAFQRTNVLHKVSWTDSDGDVVFSIPDENLHLVPGDCISLFLRDSIRRLRIDLIDYFPGKLKLTCRGDRQSAYTSNVEGLNPPPPTPPPPSIVGPTMIIVGDWPALRDEDDIATPVKYVAMGGITPAWSGALGEQSTDGGNSYSDMVEVYRGAIMGTIMNEVSDAAPYFADHTNSVDVMLDIDDGSIEIDSLTELQFLTEQGGFALVKSDGSFEIMQYRDSEETSDGIYRLSYLQRGRLDSTTHSFSTGDRFVLLESVAAVTAPISQIGVDVYHRATSFGQTVEDGTVIHDEFEGNSQREWPVAHVILSRVSSNISINVVPRNRFGTEINPVRSINWTHYLVEIEDSLGATDSFNQISDSFTYDASSMTFPVTVTVYQVNRMTGAGSGKSEVIE
jgi:hypothetical protein